jgi:spermidine/putrescine transport system permease protein
MGRPVRVGDHVAAAVPALWLGFFFIAPFGFDIVFSFGRSFVGRVELDLTFANYATVLSGFYAVVFLRTLLFAVSASFLCLVFAFPLAYFAARQAGWRRVLAMALVIGPYISSFLIRVMSLRLLLSRGGFVEMALNTLGLHHGPLEVLDTQTAVLIGMVYAYLPIAGIPLFVVLNRIPHGLLEASRDLGASRWQTFLSITLPLSRPGIATALLLTTVPMLGEMVIPRLLGGGRGVLMGQAIAAQYLQAQNYPLGSAMAVLVLLVVVAIIGLLAWFSRGFAELRS